MSAQIVPPVDSRHAIEDVGVRIANSSMLLITSVLLLHVAIQEGSPRPWIEWTELICSISLAIAAYSFFRLTWNERTACLSARQRTTKCMERLVVPTFRSWHKEMRAPTCEVVFLLVFCSLPFATDMVLRRILSHGNPWEIQLTLSIRNLMLGLMVLPAKVGSRLAVLTSLFLAIYGAIVGASVATYGLLAAYALSGLWWLMGDYWQRLSARFPDESTTEIPYIARASAVTLVLLSLGGGALAIPAASVTRGVAGFTPSSGGTSTNDPFARGGVGDGDQMVGATDDADSFGPIESTLFLESQQPTLYDMFIDTYESAVPKKRDSRSRAISLSSKENQKQNHTKRGQNKKSSREFSAIRRESGDRERRDLDDIDSKALLYVAGRTPLHLGLAVFDHWDGRELSLQSNLAGPQLRLRLDHGDRKWATWTSPTCDGSPGNPERHRLKIINLNSPTIPMPPLATAVHIDKLHDAGFFQWEDGLLRLRGDKIPSLTVVHVESCPLHPEHLASLVLRRRNETTEPISSTRLMNLACTWTSSAQSDWERVEKICQRLRTFDHDASTFLPEESSDAVEHFLFESHRGPDFLFATSAAVLLRSLGYETRVISGLYADPNNYDRLARATAVYGSNVHFWLEVETASGLWIPAEPTPGFKVLYARQTLFQVANATLSEFVQQILMHPIPSSLAAFVVVGSFVFRRRLFVMAATVWWRFGLNTTPRQQVLRSVTLLHRLTTRKQSGRRVGQTIDQWIAAMSEPCHDSSAVAEFRSLVSWACYASTDWPALSPGTVHRICVESVNLLKQRVR